jgi:hypothetical protein
VYVGSPAARYQSRRGDVQAGSLFSRTQSVAAGGRDAGVVYGVPAVFAMGVTLVVRRRGVFRSRGGWWRIGGWKR